MKKTNLMHKLFAVLTLVAFSAMTMVSCTEKEPDPITPVDPNTPEEPVSNNHFVLGSDSLKIDAVQIVSMGDLMGTGEMDMVAIYLSNAKLFECLYPVFEEDSITIAFADMMTVFFSGTGCYGAMMSMQTEDDGDDMASGSITFVKMDENNTRIVINGTTASGVAVDVLYEGGVIDANHPTGTGSFTINDITCGLKIGMMRHDNSGFTYSITDAAWESGLNIESATSLSGTTTISDDEDQVTAGNAVMAAVNYLDKESQETVDLDITNGTMSTTVNGAEYSISFSGTTEMGAVSGSYTGKIVEIFTDNLAKRMQAKIAKAMKK